jgi:hypothetical protein
VQFLKGKILSNMNSIFYMPFESSFQRLKKMAHVFNLVFFFFGELRLFEVLAYCNKKCVMQQIDNSPFELIFPIEL